MNEAFGGWVGRDRTLAPSDVPAAAGVRGEAGWASACDTIEVFEGDDAVFEGVSNERPDFSLEMTVSSTSSSVSESITIKSSSTPVSEPVLNPVADLAVV